MTTDRLSRLREAIAARDIAAVAVVPGANLRYLAGLDMCGNERLTVAFFPAQGQPVMVLPALEAPRAQAQALTQIRFYTWNDTTPETLRGPAALRGLDLGLDGQRVGVEYSGDARAGAARHRGDRQGSRPRTPRLSWPAYAWSRTAAAGGDAQGRPDRLKPALRAAVAPDPRGA